MKSAIVGLGAIAPTHYDAITRAGGEVVAICDTDGAQAERFRAKTGCAAPLFPSLKEMLCAGGFDVLHICTPHYLHAEMVTDALTAGYHVLCEKPLCIKEEDIPRILEAEKKSGRRLGVCLQNRYNAANLEARRLSEGARAGFGTVVWERNEGYYASGSWRGKWETEGGGVMINQALHTLDLLIWMLGMPKSVQATCENRHLGGVIEVEDTASALFTYEDGRCFNFYATTAGGADMPVQITLAGNGHTVTATPDTLTLDGHAVEKEGGHAKIGKDVWGDGHAKLVADFYRSVEEDTPFAIDGEEGAKVVRAILAMYRSSGKETLLTKGEDQ